MTQLHNNKTIGEYQRVVRPFFRDYFTHFATHQPFRDCSWRSDVTMVLTAVSLFGLAFGLLGRRPI
jgi:hypothetical protein